MKKLALLLLSITACMQAVVVKNELDQSISIHDVTFDDHREIALLPVEVQPGEIWERPDIESLFISTHDKRFSRQFCDLTPRTFIIVDQQIFEDDLVSIYLYKADIAKLLK